MNFHAYLFFGGNCREAFTRYHDIFGGELQILTTADMPAEEQPEGVPADMVMHAALIFENTMIMASDDPTTDSFGPVQGMQVSVSVDDTAEAERVFTALSEGGQVNVPLGPTSWSPAFGMCVDRFGTPWMVGTNAG